MSNTELLRLLVPKMGHDAARMAVLNRSANIALGIIALASIGLFRLAYANNMTWLVYGTAAVALLALTFAIYTKARAASALSKHLNVHVAWYSMPGVVPINKFDDWLDKLKTG